MCSLVFPVYCPLSPPISIPVSLTPLHLQICDTWRRLQCLQRRHSSCCCGSCWDAAGSSITRNGWSLLQKLSIPTSIFLNQTYSCYLCQGGHIFHPCPLVCWLVCTTTLWTVGNSLWQSLKVPSRYWRFYSGTALTPNGLIWNVPQSLWVLEGGQWDWAHNAEGTCRAMCKQSHDPLCLTVEIKAALTAVSLSPCCCSTGPERSEEVPGESTQPLGSHPGHVDQQGFRLHDTRGVLGAADRRHLFDADPAQHPRQPAEVLPLHVHVLQLQHHFLLLQPGLPLLRPPDGAARTWSADDVVHPSWCADG